MKVGSNVLTRPDGRLDISRMAALVDQIAELHRRGMEIMLISSGAVALLAGGCGGWNGEGRGGHSVLDCVS